MRVRLAISLYVALLLGMQGPACMALCHVEAEPRAERVADQAAPAARATRRSLWRA